MKKLIYSILIMITVLLAFSVCVYANNDISYSNGTDVYSNGIIEFYSNRDDEDKLYKLNLSDMTEEKVLDEHIISMVHKDNYLYLLVYANGNSHLVKFDTIDNTYAIEKGFNNLITNIAIRHNVLYYVENGSIFTYNVDTKENSTLIENGITDLIVFTGYNTLKYYTKDNEISEYTENTYFFDGIEPIGIDDINYGIALMSTSSYSPRLTAPAEDNAYYTSLNVFHTSGFGMVGNNGNCTCYAYGRSYENLGSKPKLCTKNAENWYKYNKDNGYYSYGKTPALGAVVVWSRGVIGDSSDGAGHVAVVEVINGDTVTTSESGWESYYFKTVTRSASNSNFSQASKYTFQGFIYVCGTNSTPEEPETDKTPGKPVLKSMNSTYWSKENIAFSWNSTANTTHYNLYITKYNGSSYAYYENVFYAESGLTKQLPNGDYRVQLQSTNKNYYLEDNSTWLYTDGDWVYFSVFDAPEKPVLKNMKSDYLSNEGVVFLWNATDNTTHNNLYLDILEKGEYKRLKAIHYAESGLEQVFEPGKYRVQLQSTNRNYYLEDNYTWLYTDGDWIYFSVAEKDAPYTSSTVTKNENILTIYTELYNLTTPYEIIIVGYKNNRFVTMERVPHNEQNSPYSLEGDIDKIKVMVWSDLSTLKPLCEAEEITSDKFIIEY